MAKSSCGSLPQNCQKKTLLLSEELASPFSLSVSPSWHTLRFPGRTGKVLTSCWRTAHQHWEGPGRGTVAHALTTTHWLAGSQMGRDSRLFSLSLITQTPTNQPTNRGRQEKRDHKRCVGRGGLSPRVETNTVVASVLLLTLGNHHFSRHPVLQYPETAGRCLDGLNFRWIERFCR